MPDSINVFLIDSRTQSSYSINNSLCPQICPRTTKMNNNNQQLAQLFACTYFDHLPKVPEIYYLCTKKKKTQTFAAFHKIKNRFLCKMQKHKRESERETKSDLLVFIYKKREKDKDLCVEKKEKTAMYA